MPIVTRNFDSDEICRLNFIVIVYAYVNFYHYLGNTPPLPGRNSSGYGLVDTDGIMPHYSRNVGSMPILVVPLSFDHLETANYR